MADPTATSKAQMVEALHRLHDAVKSSRFSYPTFNTDCEYLISLAANLHAGPPASEPPREAFDEAALHRALPSADYSDCYSGLDMERRDSATWEARFERLARALHARGLSLDEIVSIAKGEKT